MSEQTTVGEEDGSHPVKTILIVEDDAEMGAFLIQALKDETPYQALLVTDGFQALKAIRTIRPNLFLLDYQLPSMDGLELYDHLHASEGLEQIPMLLMSAHPPQREIKQRGLRCLEKPFELEELLQTVRELLEL